MLNDIKNIEIYNLGIGKEEGYANFNEDLDLLPNSGSFRFDSFGKKLRVTTLDIILEQQSLDSFEVIFVKMDLEGYEFDGLLGSKKILLNINLLYFLSSQECYYKIRHSPRMLLIYS